MFSPQSQHEFMISYKDDTSYFEVPPEWVAPITKPWTAIATADGKRDTVANDVEQRNLSSDRPD